LETTRMCPFISSNLGPPTITSFLVCKPQGKHYQSVAHRSIPLSSARKVTICKPQSETTPEHMLLTGTSVRCPSPTRHAL
jgi:hypothetical protein